MKSLCVIFLTVVASAAFFGCSAPVANTNTANANANTVSTPAGPPTVETLMALETTAFDAFKKKDGNYFEGFLTDKFVGSTHGHRLDKMATIKMIADHKCDIKSFSFADEKLTNVGADTAIITMKVTPDGTCEGQTATSFISASLYVRNSTEWKAAWHGEVPIVDPKAPPPAKKGDKDSGPKVIIRSMADSETRELAAIEKSVWEGWMNRDAKKLDSLTARELAFVNIFGGYFTNRADTLKNWTENPCEIKSVDVTDAASVSVAADTSILIHKGTANGTCFGQEVGPVLGTSIYVKDGSAWKLAFTMNMSAS
ncbi:MAG: nuclear transport factor 2 family protein [Acidobacteriota bacterium]